jgi:hypothetical protein
MRKIEQIWNELEANGGTTPFVMRGYGAEGHGEIYVSWNNRERERGFAVHLSLDNLLTFQNLQGWQGIGLTLHTPHGQNKRFYLLIELKDSSHKEIFATLAEDLIHSVAYIHDERLLVQALLNRLVQWEALFSRLGTQGLTPQAQRGLYGELLFLRRLIEAGKPLALCVESWVGPFAAVQDFQRGKWAVEVKTTYGNNHQKIHISSNRQLDDTGVDSLFLYHVSLDARPGGSETLNSLVKEIQWLLSGDLAVTQAFQSKLGTGGYIEEHAHFYDAIGYTIRSEESYEIAEGFPRIIESETPDGVGDVKYSIIASYCSQWAIDWLALITNFKS